MLLSLYRYRSLYRLYRSRKERRKAGQEKERKGRRDGRSKEESKGRRWGGMKNLKLHNLYNSWQLVSRLTTHFPLSPLIKLLSLPLHQNCSSQGYQGHPRGYTKESVVISPHFELHHLLAMYLLSSSSPRNTSFTWLPSHHTHTHCPGFAGSSLPDLLLSADIFSLAWCLDVGVSRNSVLWLPPYTVCIHSLGDLILSHCFQYYLHSNSSFFLLFWIVSSYWYCNGYLIYLLACLRLIFKIKLLTFPHQTQSWDRLRSLSSGHSNFAIAQNKTPFYFTHIMYPILQDP